MLAVWVHLVGCAPGSLSIGVESPTTTAPPPTTSPGTLPPGTEPPTTTPDDPPAPAQDYRVVGPYTVDVRNETADVGSCSGGIDYTVYRPNGIDPPAIVMLAHGWVREKEFMADWAEHWATWGVGVVTPNLCHTEITDTDHEQNALDLLALQAVVAQGTPVLWAGHSAGGLATLLATVGDPTALGHLGLDLVDSEDLGVSVGPNVVVPAALLSGEATSCNTDQNGLPVYAAIPGSDALVITGADHCDFESPTDWGCTTWCWGEAGDDAVVHDAILGLSTAWVLWRTGVAPSAAEWWSPGTTWYDELDASGAIRRP